MCCIAYPLCHPPSSGSEQDGQVCVESNCSGFCWKAKVESIQCAECAGVGVLCLEETPKSLLWNSWLWHSLVAVGKVFCVRSQEGLVQLNLPVLHFSAFSSLSVAVLVSSSQTWYLGSKSSCFVQGKQSLPCLSVAVMLYYRSKRKPSKSINNKKQTYLL